MELKDGCRQMSIVLTVQTSVGNIPHGVLESPDDRVDDQLELSRRNLQKSYSPSQLFTFHYYSLNLTHLGNKSS